MLAHQSCSFRERCALQHFPLCVEDSQHLMVGAGGIHLALLSTILPAISSRLNYNRLQTADFLRNNARRGILLPRLFKHAGSPENSEINSPLLSAFLREN